jgi:hypothetical protein
MSAPITAVPSCLETPTLKGRKAAAPYPGPSEEDCGWQQGQGPAQLYPPYRLGQSKPVAEVRKQKERGNRSFQHRLQVW